jgi:hypothetical protein
MEKFLIGILIPTLVKIFIPVHKWHFATAADRWQFQKEFTIGLLMTIAAIPIALCIWAYFQVLPV